MVMERLLEVRREPMVMLNRMTLMDAILVSSMKYHKVAKPTKR